MNWRDAEQITHQITQGVIEDEIRIQMYWMKKRQTKVVTRCVPLSAFQGYDAEAFCRRIQDAARSCYRELKPEYLRRPFRIAKGPRRLREG